MGKGTKYFECLNLIKNAHFLPDQVNTNIGNSGNIQMAMGMASNGRRLFDLESLRTRSVLVH